MSSVEHMGADASGAPDDVHAVVAIGFSAGGLAPLRLLMSTLPLGLDAAVVVAHHAPESGLGRLLPSWTRWQPSVAEEGEPIRRGRIYVCPPRKHLIVNPDGSFSVSSRERINFVRPSIDWLFECVAATFRERAIAVVLSGGNKDGAKGSCRIRQNGGLVIVQDPRTAVCPIMPAAAIQGGATLVVHPDDLGKAVTFQSAANAADRASHRWLHPFGPPIQH